jgi:uncharacterized protein (TIGR01244 family)
MPFRLFALCWVVLIFAVPATCDDAVKSTSSDTPPQKIEDIEGVTAENLYLDGRVYIAGQPDEAALAKLAERGVTTVVNARTPSEMENREMVPFDEAAVVDELGLAYVTIPLGGEEFPYEPAAVEKLAEALVTNEGPVLLHCTYGGRAVYLWIAYLVRYQNLTLEEAVARGEAMLLRPHPIGRLLDRPTRLVFAD